MWLQKITTRWLKNNNDNNDNKEITKIIITNGGQMLNYVQLRPTWFHVLMCGTLVMYWTAVICSKTKPIQSEKFYDLLVMAAYLLIRNNTSQLLLNEVE